MGAVAVSVDSVRPWDLRKDDDVRRVPQDLAGHVDTQVQTLKPWQVSPRQRRRCRRGGSKLGEGSQEALRASPGGWRRWEREHSLQTVLSPKPGTHARTRRSAKGPAGPAAGESDKKNRVRASTPGKPRSTQSLPADSRR